MNKSALIIGLNIGSVYQQELISRGWSVETLDIDKSKSPTYCDIKNVQKKFDVAIICCPNFLHEFYIHECSKFITNTIIVEKPGVEDKYKWDLIKKEYHQKIFMVKNNYYRKQNNNIKNIITTNKIQQIDINWTNKNRIPFPGFWFTNKEKSFGGVSRDLLPHLLHFSCSIFCEKYIKVISSKKHQYWNIDSITSTDYGVINKKDPIYNVDDHCKVILSYNNIPINITCSWKDIDSTENRNIIITLDDNSKFIYDFGLCPAVCYGDMVEHMIKIEKNSSEYETQHNIDDFVYTIFKAL